MTWRAGPQDTDRPSHRGQRRTIGKCLAGILTCASLVLNRLPRACAPVACWPDLRAYSCGAVAEFHRSSQLPDSLFVVCRRESCQRRRDVGLQLKRKFSNLARMVMPAPQAIADCCKAPRCTMLVIFNLTRREGVSIAVADMDHCCGTWVCAALPVFGEGTARSGLDESRPGAPQGGV